MAVELLALSKFKLQLLALIAQTRGVREGERAVREELQLSIQRREQIEAEYTKRLQDLPARIVSLEESHCRLDSKIKYLETEKNLLEKKETELKEIINGLLASREALLDNYNDSTYQLKRSIQKRDKKLVILTEKMDAQFQLFDSIEKEAAAVKQAVNTVEDIVNGKEQEVSRLKRKVDQITTLGKDFVERILYLEKKLSNHQLELRRKDADIINLNEKLEAEKLSRKFQPQIEELQTTLLVKDELIQRLTMEKQKLHLQLGKMEVVLRKIQDPVLKLISQDQEMLLPALGSQETRDMINTDKHISCGSPGTASKDIPMIDNPYKDPDASSVHHHVGMNSTTDAGD
ncbi:coiled-coil domain-containing protein 18-like isoform X1 [Zingiber officinale]|uniref:coiled-coil domain-containing protein 18-like isoform X1 n=1 Tax=Zingiber officinale TaxID=94328 RepID=UPI001C4AA18E|nr:coiled-coil domain-containing protein 18-like isoform X1 [Zingiber officinale]